MKRHRKLVSLIIALAFVLTLALPVGFVGGVAQAAVSKKVDENVVAKRLQAVDILKGYPDGDFGFDKTITRAEFAAIVVRMRGMESAAESSKGSTKFPDVKADAWYTGYINLASGNGIIKGDPEGTFRPNDPVNYAEAAAMLVRALGYEPAIQASYGTWPNNYLSKAAELGILDNVNFNWKDNARRGDVFVMVDNSLDVKLMEQKSYGTDISYEKTDKTVLEKYLKVKVYDEESGANAYKRVVKTPRYAIGTLEPNEIQFKDDATIYEVASWINPDDFMGMEVEAWVDDDDVVLYLAPSGDEKIVYDKLDAALGKDGDNRTLTDGLDLVVLDDIYKFADTDGDGSVSDEVLYFNGEKYTVADIAAGGALNGLGKGSGAPDGAFVKAILNDDDEIVFCDILDYSSSDDAADNTYMVRSVDAQNEYIEYWDIDGGESTLDLDGEDYIVVKNGKQVGLGDLKEYDVIRVFQIDDDYYIVASDQKVSGTVDDLSSINPSLVGKYTLKVAGKSYKVNYRAAISTDNLDSFDAVETTDLRDLVGEDVTLYLNPHGHVAFISTGAELEGADVGVIVRSAVMEYNGDYTVRILNKQGQELTFTFDPDDVEFNWYESGGAKKSVDEFDQVITGGIYNGKTPYEVLQIDDDNDLNKFFPVEYDVNSSGKLTGITLLLNDPDLKWAKRR